MQETFKSLYTVVKANDPGSGRDVSLILCIFLPGCTINSAENLILS